MSGCTAARASRTSEACICLTSFGFLCRHSHDCVLPSRSSSSSSRSSTSFHCARVTPSRLYGSIRTTRCRYCVCARTSLIKCDVGLISAESRKMPMLNFDTKPSEGRLSKLRMYDIRYVDATGARKHAASATIWWIRSWRKALVTCCAISCLSAVGVLAPDPPSAPSSGVFWPLITSSKTISCASRISWAERYHFLSLGSAIRSPCCPCRETDAYHGAVTDQ